MQITAICIKNSLNRGFVNCREHSSASRLHSSGWFRLHSSPSGKATIIQLSKKQKSHKMGQFLVQITAICIKITLDREFVNCREHSSVSRLHSSGWFRLHSSPSGRATIIQLSKKQKSHKMEQFLVQITGFEPARDKPPTSPSNLRVCHSTISAY